MDLTDRQRRLLFGGLVVVLVAAGIILKIGNGGRGRSHAARSAPPTARPTTSAPPVTGPPPSPGSYDIYSLLPFSKQEFNSAADLARRFTEAYGTYRFDEDPNAYIGRLQNMVTTDLASQLKT